MIHIRKPDRGLLEALEAAGVLQPAPSIAGPTRSPQSTGPVVRLKRRSKYCTREGDCADYVGPCGKCPYHVQNQRKPTTPAQPTQSHKLSTLQQSLYLLAAAVIGIIYTLF